MNQPPRHARLQGSVAPPAAPHRRWFEIAGVTVQVESELPFAAGTFDRRFASFAREGPGADTVVLSHHFSLPAGSLTEGGREVYRKPPWAIHETATSWVYEGIAARAGDPELHRVAVFDRGHTRGELYNPPAAAAQWRAGGLTSLSMFPTDQIWLARLLPDRDACYLHSAGVVLDGHGLVFVGHSDAGKSTTVELVKRALGERVEILCDDRTVVRRWPPGDGAEGASQARRGYWVHGSWSHGDVPEVSSAGAPLRAVLFLAQAGENALVALDDRKAVWHRLLATVIRPVVGGKWWARAMDVLEGIVAEVPCYLMRFDRSGAIVPELERLTR